MTSLSMGAVKSVIPRSSIVKIKQLRDSLAQFGLRLHAYSQLTSWLYFTLVSRSFWREQYGVIYGKLKFYENLQQSQDSNFLLRRNIHRLEKGLIMQPRRAVFATSYIEETVKLYTSVLQSQKGKHVANGELEWGHDVLKMFFSVADSHPAIDAARAKFTQLEAVETTQQSVPYKRDLDAPLSVDYEQFLNLSVRRRSVRWYLPKPVPRELIDQAIKAAALSPSACNRQPFEFRIFDTAEMVSKVAKIPMGTAGFHHNFPAIIVVVGKLRAYNHPRDRHVIYIDGSLASMSLMYAFETLGLSTCPINWPDLEPQESQMTELLNLDPDERVIMLISVGYPDPDGLVPYSQKKSLDELRRYG